MDYNLLFELSIILFGAFLGGIVASKLKQPLVIGYIVAGLFLGAFVPKISGGHGGSISTLSEIGVALLLFTLGLEFSLERIKKVGKGAVIGAVAQIILVIIVFTALLNLVFNLSINVSLFLSSIIALSSTAVVAKILAEEGSLESSHGDLILSWLVVQDIAVIPLILLMPSFADFANFDLISVLVGLLKSAIAIYLVMIVGKKTVPFIFKKLALYNNRELMLVSAFLFCIGVSAIANYVGISFAVGAFLAGVLLSTSAVNHEVFTEIRPLRDLFASVFFVSLGFLVSLNGFFANILPALLLTLLIFIIKALIVFILLVRLNYHSKISFYAAFSLFQIGEFGFLLAKIGSDKNILTSSNYELIILSSILTLVLTPVLYKSASPSYKYLKRFTQQKIPFLHNLIFVIADSDAKLPSPRKLNIKNHIILVGFGRVGRYISRVLDLAKIPYVVIDVHFKTLHELRKKGVLSVYGDASNIEVLKVAGIENAKALIIAIPNLVTSELILSNARQVNPGVFVITRAHRDEDIAKLAIRGVKNIIEPEFEAGLEMGKRILKNFEIGSIEIRKFIAEVRRDRRY